MQLPTSISEAISQGRLAVYLDTLQCSKCGCTGLHACIGKRLEPMTPEREAEFRAALQKVFEDEGRV